MNYHRIQNWKEILQVNKLSIKGVWRTVLRILISNIGTMNASFLTFEMSNLSHPATPHPHHPLLKHTYLKSKETAYITKEAVTELRSSQTRFLKQTCSTCLA